MSTETSSNIKLRLRYWICRCAYRDYYECFNMYLIHGGFCRSKQSNESFSEKIPSDLKTLNDLLKKSSTTFYYDQPEPTIADYFVFEAFLLARPYYVKLLPAEDDHRALEKLVETMQERPALANYFSKDRLYKRCIASSKEAEYIAKLAETQKADN